MRVAITSISFCEYIIEQANALAGLGHSVMIVAPATLIEKTVGRDIEKLLAPAIRCYTYVPIKKWTYRFYAGIFKAVRSFCPDVIHIHDNGELETLALAVRFYRTPLVVTVHDVTTHPGADSRIKLRRKIIKWLVKRRAKQSHIHGETLRSKLSKIDPKLAAKSRVIAHGTLSLFKTWESVPIKREPLTCLFFGRMEKYRGLDNLVRIGGILKKELPGIRIVVAGIGSELDKYKPEMTAIGVFEIHDTFIPDPEVYKFFRRASLLLLPYHEASQSGVMMMGLTFGLPVVAMQVGAIAEIIVDGQHGRITPAGDLYGFAGAVRELLCDENRRQRMSKACLKLSEALSFRSLAGEYESMYAQAITAKKNR